MNKKSSMILLFSVVVLALIVGSIGIVMANNSEALRLRKQEFQESLTNEQKEALRFKVQEMRDAGASLEEIKTEVIKMLQEWDIEIPEFPSLFRQRLLNRRCRRIKTSGEP